MAKVETIREKRKGKELTQVSETEDNASSKTMTHYYLCPKLQK
jgi:hypothetical protein